MIRLQPQHPFLSSDLEHHSTHRTLFTVLSATAESEVKPTEETFEYQAEVRIRRTESFESVSRWIAFWI